LLLKIGHLKAQLFLQSLHTGFLSKWPLIE
jgi:hypothetical protein